MVFLGYCEWGGWMNDFGIELKRGFWYAGGVGRCFLYVCV